MSRRRKCILNCPVVRGSPLYSFPRDEVRRQVWLGLLNLEYTTKIHTYLCARHFSQRMIGKTRLKYDAVPDLHLNYVERAVSNLEEESQFDCIGFQEDSNTNSEEEPDFPTQIDTGKSTPKNPVKMVVLPKNLKIVPIKNVTNDPLFLPKTELSSESIKKQMFRIVDGRVEKVNSQEDQEEITETQTTAVQFLVDSDKALRQVQKNRQKNVQKPSNMRAPLAPLEMRLATRIWQSSEWETESCQKLPTLQTKQKRQTLPVRCAVNITSNNKVIAGTGIVSSTENHVVSPAGPMRVKNIHDVDDAWKEQARKVAEDAKILIAKAQEHMNSYAMESNELIEEDFEIEHSQNFMLIDESSISNEVLVASSVGSDVNCNSKSLNVLKNNRSMSDLLCDEVLPNDDDLLESKQESTNTKSHQNNNTGMEFINEEVFDEKKNQTSSNILMMGIEDFKKIADDCPEYDSMTFISEAAQTGFESKRPCGFIERHTYNGTFSLTCFYCAEEFALWDWQLFVDHVTFEHKSDMKPKVRNVALTREVTIKLPRKQPLRSYPHYTPEDFDTLLSNANVQHVLVQGAEPNTLAVMPLQDLLNGKTHSDPKNSRSNNTEENISDCDRDSLSSFDNDEFEQNADIIHFKKTEPARVMQFLEILREHPMLWLTRRNGPTIYDEETDKFLMKFDKRMTAMNFRSSLDHMRVWYRRFVPPTSATKAKLEGDPQCIKYVKLLSEIEELSKNFAFYCDRCPYYFLDQDRLDTHNYLKHNIGDLKYPCSCGLRFAEANIKNAHELTHKPKPSFMCELCGMSFLFNRSLLNHMNTNHAEVIEDPLPYKCNDCDARFPSAQSRSWHAFKHTAPRFHCSICGQSYHKSFPYKQHMKKHFDQRDFICEDCGKAFVEKRGLNNHRYRVHKATAHHCVYCNSYYSCYEKLFMHNQLRHPNGTNTEKITARARNKSGRERKRRSCCSYKPRVFKCKQCGTTFERQYQLMRHKRLMGHHLGERFFKCSNCSVVCRSRVALVRHLRCIHDLPITFGDIKEEDYFVPTFEQGKEIEQTVVVNEESELAVRTITCADEEHIIVQDEEIQEIFEKFSGDYSIEQETANDHVS